jgi:hypothetical protein
MLETMKSLSSALLAGAVACTSCSASGRVTGEDAAVAGITDAHNLARRLVTPAASPPLGLLTWSDDLAADAREAVATCRTPTPSTFGTNILISPAPVSANEVVAHWTAEAADYDYASDTCKSDCHEYEQVVYRTSQRVGCAVANCPDGSPIDGGAWQFWLCRYDPSVGVFLNRPY